MAHLDSVRRLRAGLLAVMLLVGGCQPATETAPVDVTLVALNDFHGYLQSSPFSYQDASGRKVTLKAGGIGAVSGLLAELRSQDPALLFVGVGDLVGGSPPISAMWADEPALDALELMGLRLSVLGNHELDHGKAELLRQINGGCTSSRPDKACRFKPDYNGLDFPYIAANLIDESTGRLLLAPYYIEEVKGVKIAFVGAVIEEVAQMVSVDSMRGLHAVDEADAINGQLPALAALGVDAVIAVIHQGGSSKEPYDKADCTTLGGDIVNVVERLDPQIKVVLSAHSHQGYTCKVGDVLVTQGASYGRLLTRIKLKIDPAKDEIIEAAAENIVVDPERYPAQPAVAALQAEVEARSDALLSQPVARLAVSQVPAEQNDAGESAMGNVIADAQLAATKDRGADIAFMNMGGIRGALRLEPGQSQVTFGQVAAIQPFNNTLVVLSLTGAQLRALLESQWRGAQGEDFRPLQPAASLVYRWDPKAPVGARILADSLRVNGEPVRDDARYGVTVNSFLADGGDGFSILTEAQARLDSGVRDVDALIDYLKASDTAGTPAGRGAPAGRIAMENTP